MLSDGTEWAPETCQAERYWVWTTSRCRGECGAVAVVTCPWAQGLHRVPPGSRLRGGHLQLVQEVVQGRDAFLQAFALARLCHHLAGAAGAVEGVTGQDLPVVEHTLGKGLAARVGPQVSGEACRRHRDGTHRAAQVWCLTAPWRRPGGEGGNTGPHQRITESGLPGSCQMSGPLSYPSPKGSLKGY